MSAYASLVELARREAALAAAGCWEEAVRVGEERLALLASLPAPSAENRAELEEARALVEWTVQRARASLAQIAEELDRLQSGRRAVSAYLRCGVLG